MLVLAPLVLALGAVPAAGTLAAESTPAVKPAYRLGVVPYMPALTIDRLYGPLADTLSLELGRLVKLRTKSTLENFEQAVAAASYDILFLHPFLYVDAVDRFGYRPLARPSEPFRTVLVTRADSGLGSLQDLAGATVGLPPRLAATSHLLKAAAMDAGLRPGLDLGMRHFRNRGSCLQAVLAGTVDACGLPSFALPGIDEGMGAPDEATAPADGWLRVMFEGPPVSHFAFAVHSRVPPEDRERLKGLLLALESGAEAGAFMTALGLEGGFVPVGDEDYASIRSRLSRLQTLAQR